MASSLIAGAVSLLLIIVAGYVIATGILMVAETTVYTQMDVSYNQELIKQTDISMDYSWDSGTLSLNVFNNGSTSFTSKDFLNMDLFTYDSVNKTRRYSKANCDPFNVTTASDIINKGMWDPSEVLLVNISLTQKPTWAKFVTPNGVTATLTVI
jgi:hypothetical protein